MRTRQYASALLATALAISGAAATAASSAQGSISGVQWTLIDLDVNDGVSPSITWSYTGDLLSATARQGEDQQDAAVTWRQNAWFGMTNATASQPGVLASAAVVGDAVVVQGSAYRPGTTVTLGEWGGFWAHASPASAQSLWLSLSPNTRLVVSGTASVEATTTVGFGYDQNYNLADESAEAMFTLTIFDSRNYSNRVSSFLYASASGTSERDPATGQWVFSGQHDASTRSFSVAFDNTNATNLGLSVSFDVRVQGFSPFTAAPVPEPSTGLLALLGLPWVVRRARRA